MHACTNKYSKNVNGATGKGSLESRMLGDSTIQTTLTLPVPPSARIREHQAPTSVAGALSAVGAIAKANVFRSVTKAGLLAVCSVCMVDFVSIVGDPEQLIFDEERMIEGSLCYCF